LIACQPFRTTDASTSSSSVLPDDGAADVIRRYGVANAASKACVCRTHIASRSAASSDGRTTNRRMNSLISFSSSTPSTGPSGENPL